MNKFTTFFAAPLTAFFMPKVYRDAAAKSGIRGVLYQLYLAGLSTLFFGIFLNSVLIPQGDRLAEWTSKNVPVMTWVPEQGLSMEDNGITQPFLLNHPTFGSLAVINLNKVGEVTAQDLGDAYLYLTSTALYVKKAAGALERRDLKVSPQADQQMPSRVRITGELILNFYQTIKKTLLPVLTILFMAVVFSLYLIWALLYSLAGLLFNITRKSRLGYGPIFNLSSFAMSIGFTITCLKLFTPLRVIPWPVILTVIITLGYLFFAFKITDQEKNV